VHIRDVTEYLKLQEEQQRVHLMKTLQATLTHDMMTPIINIKFFASEMLKAGLKCDMQQLQKFHSLVLHSGKLIQGRVKDLLDQNLIEHNSFTPVQMRFDPVQAIR
jgi:K+-sensing histidine kinase KdpD